MATSTLVYDERIAPSSPRRDKAVWIVIGTTLILSIAAFVYASQTDILFGHRDTISHLMIARRAVAGDKPQLLLLGSVWLPLEHLLMLPLIWLTPLYYSGIAGAIVSGGAYIVTAVCLYKITLHLTGSRVAGIAGAAVFELNPNMLYLQTTAMMEPVFFATIAGNVLCIQRWIQTDRHGYMIAGGLVAMLGCLSRYEGWLMLFVYTAVAGLVAWRKKSERHCWVVFTFFAIGVTGIGGWLAYNQLFFGDWLYFRTGEYGDPRLWESLADPSIGNWGNALATYWFAVRDDLHIVVVLLGVAGCLLMLAQRRLAVLPILATLVLFPFFVYSIEGAQSPLRVMQVAGSMFNLRYGLAMLLPAAVAIGYVVGQLRAVPLRYGAALLTGMLSLLPLIPNGPTGLVTVQEARAGMQSVREDRQYDASQFLARHYDGGRLLAESANNEAILFDGRIPLENNAYEGTYKTWDKALADPAGTDIRWIVMRRAVDTTVKRTTTDKVFDALHNSSALREYEQVFADNAYLIYRKK